MNRRIALTLSVATSLIVAAISPAGAQSLKQQIVGTWALIRGIEKLPNGTTAIPWEAGRLLLDANGHGALFLVGKNRAKASRDAKMPAGPFVALYGTYTVDEGANKLTLNVEIAAAPQFEKGARVLTVSIKGDTMETTGSPVREARGNVVPINDWQRTR